MCELTKEAYEADTHESLAIGPAPTRKTWYGLVGARDDYLAPRELTDNLELAKAQAVIHNAKYAPLGPWHVVVLTENLHVMPERDPGVAIDGAEYAMGAER